MMSTTAYFEWLNQFTQDKDGFSDEDWLYSPEKIKEYDRKKVDELNLFYKGIDKYAGQNHIFPTPCAFGSFYRVRLNESGFEIGVLTGQGTIFFCKKVSVENEQEFIDFNDIMISKKQEGVDKINAILDSLSNMVLTAYESGVPIQAIMNTLDTTIKEITSKEEDKANTLTKKLK